MLARRSHTLPWILLLFLSLVLFSSGQKALAAPNVTRTVNGGGGGDYLTLKAAFDDINAGLLTGDIILDVTGDTTETAPAVLNASGSGAASYTSVLVQPSGGAARTISGAIVAGSPLIDLNGADNVTINGLNTGGNSLTIANTTVSPTSGTSTIRFIGGATSNTITNANIQGSGTMSVATNGAVIFFSTDALTANGNDNNTISNNNIGPAGANLPTKGILCNGSTTTTAIGNSGVLVTNNNIFDYFGAAVTSSGIASNGGCNTWTITNNRLYQTGTRTWTTGASHRAIDIGNTSATSGAQGFTITGNIIGYASSTQTGTYTLTGSTGKFQGIVFNGITGGTLSDISNNTIASVSLTGVTSNGTSTSSPFLGILVTNGVANTNNNTIGSQSATGSLTFSTNSTATTDVHGIYNFSLNNWTATGNNIGGIAVTNAAASGTYIIYGLRANTGTTVSFTATSNNIGGTVANSIQLTATGTASQVIGMHTSNAPALFTANTIRNLTTNIGTGTTTTASVIGINVTTATPNHTLSQNTIYNLSNTNATAASVVTGIQFTGSTANVVERNLIYGLTVATNSAAAEVNGIRVAGGTTIYRNNMIALGAGIANAIGAAATNSSTVGIVGINEFLGTDQFFHNSVYIGGTATAGTGSSYAFNGVQTTNTRSFRDNIFFNARTNSGATGKHYAIKINGTTPNPTGLTLNNNIYFANGTGAVFGFFNGADVANLAGWKVAVGQDGSSFEANPQYNDPTNAVPDLHLHPTNPTVAEGNGVDLGVTNDYDGQTRSTLTPVDIGGDAGNFIGLDLLGPTISYTALGNTALTTDRVLVATLTDVTGVPTSGGLQPRIYYKKGLAGAWFSSQGVLASGTGTNGTWNFTIVAADMGGVAAADTIYYYVIAQDTLGNLASNPAGVVASDVNTVITPPTTPNSYLIVAAFNGSYDVGVGQTYTSLTNAGGIFEAINAGALTGNVVINIVSDLSGELGTNALNQWPEDGVGGYTILIKPSGGPRLVTGSINGALIRLFGADRVRLDGSTAATLTEVVGGTPALRELTIQNTNIGTSAAVIAVQSGTNGAQNNTIKNVNVIGQDPTTTLIGIALGGNTVGTVGTDNDGNRIENCTVQKAIYGIYAAGQNATNPNTGTVITMNDLTATGTNRVRRVGILVFNEDGIQITENSIGGLDTNESADAIGIGVGIQGIDATITTSGGVINALITNNKVNGVASISTTGFSAVGIALAGGTGSNTLANNMITGVTAPATSPDLVAGIFVAGVTGSTSRLYYNSVSMTGDRGTVATQMPSYGLAVTGTDPTVILRNNIFYTTQTASGGGVNAKSYALGMVTTTFVNLDSNNNIFWSTGANDGGFRSASLGAGTGTDYATLALWQAAVSDDSSSVEADPLFTSTSNLSVVVGTGYDPASPASNRGVAVPGFSSDMNGVDVRDASRPDIGADEFVVNRTLSITGTLPGGLNGRYDNITVTQYQADAGGLLDFNGNLNVNAGAQFNLATYGLSVEGTITNNGTLQQTQDVVASATTRFLYITNVAGASAKYYGVDITTAGVAMGNTTVKILGNQAGGCAVLSGVMNRCFDITPTTATPVTMRLWFTEAERNSAPANAARLWHWDGLAWGLVGNNHQYSETGATCISGSGTACWSQADNVSSFSPFILRADGSPTAIQLQKLAVSSADAHMVFVLVIGIGLLVLTAWILRSRSRVFSQ